MEAHSGAGLVSIDDLVYQEHKRGAKGNNREKERDLQDPKNRQSTRKRRRSDDDLPLERSMDHQKKSRRRRQGASASQKRNKTVLKNGEIQDTRERSVKNTSNMSVRQRRHLQQSYLNKQRMDRAYRARELTHWLISVRPIQSMQTAPGSDDKAVRNGSGLHTHFSSLPGREKTEAPHGHERIKNTMTIRHSQTVHGSSTDYESVVLELKSMLQELRHGYV